MFHVERSRKLARLGLMPCLDVSRETCRLRVLCWLFHVERLKAQRLHAASSPLPALPCGSFVSAQFLNRTSGRRIADDSSAAL
jgi:hypothetical protein